MPPVRKRWGVVFLVLFFGLLIGTAFGEIIGAVLPEGVVKTVFTSGLKYGFGPIDVNLIIMSLTFGFWLKVNLTAILGVAFMARLLRWYW